MRTLPATRRDISADIANYAKHPKLPDLFKTLGGPKALARPRPRVLVPTIHYEHPDLGDDEVEGQPAHDPYREADMALIGRVAAFIQSHPTYKKYPGWEFIAQHQKHGGVLMISLQPFMGPINRYVIHIPMLDNDPTLKCVGEACGHILERYRLSRTGFSESEFIDAINARPLLMRRHDAVPE